MTRSMLTTTDNPFDPFTQYELWDSFDRQHGYFTMNLLMRVARTSPDLEDFENEREIEAAVNQLCRLNPLGIYKKVQTDSDEE